MNNKAIVEEFLGHYRNQDYQRMQALLAGDVRFSDYAFKEIKGDEVRAMWHWFCVPFGDRRAPIGVGEFATLSEAGDTVLARYRVHYRFGKKERSVDYVIKAAFTLHGGLISRQRDDFMSVSESEFATMAFGWPGALLARTPVLQLIVRRTAARKLREFMKAHPEYGAF